MPETTNRTAGHTPYVNLGERKLDFKNNKKDHSNPENYDTNESKIPKVARSVSMGKMML